MRRIRAVVGLGRAGSAPWASAFEDIVKRHSQLVSKFRRGSEVGSDVDDGEEDSPDDLYVGHAAIFLHGWSF